MGTEIMTERTDVRLRDGEDFIRLGQLLKVCGAVSSGVEAKIMILDGAVTVNGEEETRRGRKLYDGDVVDYEEYHLRVRK